VVIDGEGRWSAASQIPGTINRGSSQAMHLARHCSSCSGDDKGMLSSN
jgi:hypothetical protein